MFHMVFQRPWSLPLKSSILSWSNEVGRPRVGNSYKQNLAAWIAFPMDAPESPEDDALACLVPQIDGDAPKSSVHQDPQGFTALLCRSFRMLTGRDFDLGSQHVRRRIGIAMLSIVCVAIFLAFINLLRSLMLKSLKSNYRENELRHELHGTKGRSWVFSHNDESLGENAFVSPCFSF